MTDRDRVIAVMSGQPDPEAPEISVFVCGDTRCEHVWDGPELRFESGFGGEVSSASCSKCGRSAFDVSLWEGP